MLALVSIIASLVASLARVVGGSAVAPGEFPDVVLVAGWTGLCSGTLIAPDVVLTAGHCTEIDPQAASTTARRRATSCRSHR
ncbi:MAG TPA: trypsin-like serine protease [Kofleriaceae bacterium]|jgi:secreted trypsin-like serine protease